MDLLEQPKSAKRKSSGNQDAPLKRQKRNAFSPIQNLKTPPPAKKQSFEQFKTPPTTKKRSFEQFKTPSPSKIFATKDFPSPVETPPENLLKSVPHNSDLPLLPVSSNSGEMKLGQSQKKKQKLM